MKRLFTLLMLLASFNLLQAQLASGTVAPNFTATDIEGNTWNLYELLDEGKTVILDVSATWCGPCWTYVQGGALETVYEMYGPEGTDEVMVLFIEGDPSTGMDDLMGTTAATQGDWIGAVGYPIIDDASIADLYQISYYPTMYSVCPNRIVTEIGQVNAATHYAFASSCPVVLGNTNAGFIDYDGLEGAVCQGNTVQPSYTLQNLGEDTLTSAVIELVINGEVIETINYTGELATYDFTTIDFGTYDVDDNFEIVTNIVSVNGVDDEDPTFDAIPVSITLAETTSSAVLDLQIITDNYGYETYWEIAGEDGTIYYTGGNPGILATPATIEPGFYDNSTTYDAEIALPGDGCYEFRIYDFFGDGICCGENGDGSYTLTDADGNVLGTGGQFGSLEVVPFELVNSPGIANNGQIVTYDGLSGSFCASSVTTPEVLVQNLGSEPITSMQVDVRVNGTVIETIDYMGNIPVGSFGTVTASEFTVEGDVEIVFTIVQVNGADDVYDYRNAFTANAQQDPVTNDEDITVSLTTDQFGFETYWQIADDMGALIASGGNLAVAASGSGGNRIAGESDPGAYGNSSTFSEVVTLPADGCYTVTIWDDYGDGICCSYGSGSFTITGADGEELFSASNFGIESVGSFQFKTVVDIPTVTEVERITLAPNPANAQMWINLELTENVRLDLSVVNALGQQVVQLGSEMYTAGSHQVNLQTSQLSPGIYFLRLQEGRAITTRKFTVAH